VELDKEFFSLLDSIPDINPKLGKEVDIIGDVRLEDVHFHYQMRPENKVLKGVSLEVKSGQILALVGKSGGGKSTLIHLLLRLYDPKEGCIYIDNQPLTDLSPSYFRKQCGIVAQDTQIFNLNIEQNIAYGVENYTKEDLYEAARLANCHDFILSFEDGYETRVGERGVRLSGGQKQRIAIARVLLRKPKILFLDEATSSLDAESEAQVQEAIDNLIRLGGMTVILVAHRLSTVINSDIIAVVDQGQIVEQGNHESLLKLGGVYSKLVRRQVEKMKNTIEEGKDPLKVSTDVIDTLFDPNEEKK